MVTTPQESHIPCTPAPQPLTLHRDHVHSWPPLRILGRHPRGMHRNPQIRMQLVPSHPFLKLWLVSTCPSDTAELTALHPLKDSTLLPPGKTHSSELLTLRKAMPDPPDTKAQHKNLLLPLLSCQPHPWSPRKPPHGTAAWGQGDAGTSQPQSWTPRSHTQFGNFGIGPQVLCIRMAESLEIVS